MEGSQQTTSDKHCPNKILKLRSLTYRNNNIISMDKCHPNGWQKFKRTMYIHQPTTELHSRNYILKTDKTILAALSLRYNIVPMHKHYSWSTLELHYTILCTSKDLFASQTKKSQYFQEFRSPSTYVPMIKRIDTTSSVECIVINKYEQISFMKFVLHL